MLADGIKNEQTTRLFSFVKTVMMYTDSRKIHIIELVLKTNDEKTLSAIEQVIEKSVKKKSASAFVGIWNKEDAETIEKAIEESCEQIHPDDWK